jgi:hypothetical protein
MSNTPRKVQKVLMGAGALGALALGGSALANAASSDSSSTTNSGGPPGRHVGANGQQEQPLTGDTADKVKAAPRPRSPAGRSSASRPTSTTGRPTRPTCASPTAPSSRSS